MTLGHAFREGYEAYHMGMTSSQYEDIGDTQPHYAEWWRGWNQARDEDEYDV